LNVIVDSHNIATFECYCFQWF